MNVSKRVLLDTDILSAVIRRRPPAVERARSYLVEHQRFSFSAITQYEVLRGLLAKGATAQHRAFERFCGSSEVLALTPPIIERAAEIYADLYRRGMLIGDADILIAATALSHGYVLATNNRSHFGRIAELQIDNWLEI